MKIAVCSDLHLEFGSLELKNTENADVLILAGDIVVAEDLHSHPETDYGMYTTQIMSSIGPRQLKSKEYREFIKNCSEEFPHVIVIAGNHEFYHGRWMKYLEVLREWCSVHSNVYFMEDDHKIIDDHVFVGATLWTDLDKGSPMVLHAIRDIMNDYNVIRHDHLGFTKLKPVHTVERHRNSLKYFKQILSSHPDKKCVVVSHHAPSSKSIHEQYWNDTITNFAYHSDLSEFILDHPQIKLWTHGHVHTDFDYMIGDTRVVCHPRGYVNHERGSQLDDPYIPMVVTI